MTTQSDAALHDMSKPAIRPVGVTAAESDPERRRDYGRKALDYLERAEKSAEASRVDLKDLTACRESLAQARRELSSLTLEDA